MKLYGKLNLDFGFEPLKIKRLSLSLQIVFPLSLMLLNFSTLFSLENTFFFFSFVNLFFFFFTFSWWANCLFGLNITQNSISISHFSSLELYSHISFFYLYFFHNSNRFVFGLVLRCMSNFFIKWWSPNTMHGQNGNKKHNTHICPAKLQMKSREKMNSNKNHNTNSEIESTQMWQTQLKWRHSSPPLNA